ncbi:cyclin-D4-1-like [Salvia splendens]|uniref:cyclin-D4-1-like n=1 Tax=Salvia splendens TaxID=180675 RepID=UPI001C25C145|nr:cyclin-D4-1-like [Salvia splendens]
MADCNAFDYASADLLFCNEETKAFSFEVDDDDDRRLLQPPTHQKDLIFNNGSSSDSDSLLHLPCLSDECINHMLQRQGDHLPRDDYLTRFRNGELDVGLRKKAIDWMLKACAHFSFGELCLYTAISYFDRFLSIYELPLSSSEKGGENWAVQLVAVACLSLAAKIEEVNVPSTLDLQAEVPKLLFEGKTIQRMEILVLNRLDWKIKAYTPCNFIDYYLRKMNESGLPLGILISRSLRLILSTIEGTEFLEFKPAEIAAAVAMCVSGEMQAMDIDKALSCLIGVDKERVVKCFKMIQECKSSMRGITTTSATSVAAAMANVAPRSPNGVLDAACLSYKTHEPTVGSCPTSSHTSPITKRRKLESEAAFLGGDSSSHGEM